MHPPPTVILAPRVTDDSVGIWRTCLALGWPVTRLQGWRVPEDLARHRGKIILYGEPLFAEAAADQLGLVLLEPPVDWLVHLPLEYASRKIELLTLEEARSATTPAFVKPADGKIFEPTVYASGADLPTEEHVDGSIPVLRSEIMDFRLEVRCFVQDRQIVALSPYWRDDALALDDEGIWSFRDGEEAAARSFAERVIGDPRVALPPGCTVDVGFDASGRWVVIEANPCWGAGLYGCEPEKVLRSLADAAMKKSDLKPEDLQWVSKRRRDELEKTF